MGVPHIIGPGVGPAKELKNKEEEREARELLKSLRIDFSLGRDRLKSMTYLSEVYREIAVEVISKKEKEV